MRKDQNHKQQKGQWMADKPAFNSGMTRREFLEKAGVAALISGGGLFKPTITSAAFQLPHPVELSSAQKKTLSAVQMQIFPADGDGPSADDLQALNYLEWALSEPVNDGDRNYIIKGIGWLEDLSNTEYKRGFTQLSDRRQKKLLKKLSGSKAGDKWMSMLVYFLLEALLLDPVYGGNPDGIGWKWLLHPPGFPRPPKGVTYQSFLG